MKLLQIGSNQIVKIDDLDLAMLRRFPWRFDGRYAYFESGDDKVYMHKMLCAGNLVDHIDGDKLNNQRGNLRSTTQQVNQFNRRTRNRGVSWHAAAQKWEAYIHVDGVKTYLGLFEDERDAEVARAAVLLEVLKRLGVQS